MTDQVFWIIFWSVVLLCIVAISAFIVVTLFEFSRDLRRVRTTIENANQITSYVTEGTEKTSKFINNFTTAFSAYNMFNKVFGGRKKK